MNNPLNQGVQAILALPNDGIVSHLLRMQLVQMNLNRAMIATIAQSGAHPQAVMSLQNAYEDQSQHLLNSIDGIWSDYFTGMGPSAVALRRLAASKVDPDIDEKSVSVAIDTLLPHIYEEMVAREVRGHMSFAIDDQLYALVNNTFGINSTRRWNAQRLGEIFDDLRARGLAADQSDAQFGSRSSLLLRMQGDHGTVYGLRIMVKNKNETMISFAEGNEVIDAVTYVPLEDVWAPHNDARIAGPTADIEAAILAFLQEAGIEGFMDPVETESEPVRADDPWSPSEICVDAVTEAGDLVSFLYPQDYPVVVAAGGDVTGSSPIGSLKADDVFTIDSRHPEYAGQKATIRKIAPYTDRDEREVDTQVLLTIKLRAADGSEIEEVSALFGRLNVINADDGLAVETDVRDVAIGAKVRYDHDGVLRELEVVEITPSEVYAGEEKASVIVLKLERYGRTFHRSFSQDRIVELQDRDVSEEWGTGIIDDAKVGHFLKIDSAEPVWVLDIITGDDDAEQGVQLAVDAEEAANEPVAVPSERNDVWVKLHPYGAAGFHTRWFRYPADETFAVIVGGFDPENLPPTTELLTWEKIGLGSQIRIGDLIFDVVDFANADMSDENSTLVVSDEFHVQWPQTEGGLIVQLVDDSENAGDDSDLPPWFDAEDTDQLELDNVDVAELADANGLEQELVDTDSEDNIPGSGEDAADRDNT